ncbi:retrovirus-related pol polyprotein from transposon TNT 1-94 [Tanacetum coccineum]
MENEATDNQANLVNYDNENENKIDDLGYQSEYIEVAHEDDENNHSNGYAKRGITMLCKFRRGYGKPGGVKLSVTFDALNMISGKHRALFSSFLGDMVREHIGLQILSWKKVGPEARNKLWDEITRYFDVDLTVRKLVMNRLGQLLRNFRRKLRQTYILPNQDTPSKLNEVPTKYTAILKAEDWVNFVNYMATEEYKVKSAKAKMARSKLKKKEIEQDEEPTRGTLWLKGRVNKDGEYQDDEIRSVGDKLGGYARGVGSGVTYKRYFDLPRSKQAADERILLLESQLDAARREREEKELLIKSMSSKMSQTEGMVTKLKNQLAAQGGHTDPIDSRLKKKEIEQDEEPTRGTLWLKGRVNKDGEYQDDEIRSVGDKLKETEDKIKEGTLQVDQGTDAMTLVLGKEKGGYARGVGSGVTYKRYFDLPRSKQAADERILLLESQLDAARREREEKELLIKSMSSKMSQTKGMVSPVEIHPINSSADEEGGTTVLGCDQNDASIRKEMQKRETVKSVGAKYTTRSIRKDSLSQDSQSKENVSVLPQESNGWKQQFWAVAGLLFPAGQHHKSIQMIIGENKTAQDSQSKRKNIYISSDAMQKEANKKRSQKALVY